MNFFNSVKQVAVRVVGLAQVKEYIQKSTISECSEGGMLDGDYGAKLWETWSARLMRLT